MIGKLNFDFKCKPLSAVMLINGQIVEPSNIPVNINVNLRKRLKVKVEKVDNCKIEMTVEVPRERWEAVLSDTFNEFRKSIKMDGFRVGRVPAGLVKKLYGKVIEEEAVDKALKQFYREAVEMEKIEAITPADIWEYDYAEEKPFTFKAIIEVEPEIELKGLDNIITHIEDVQIDDEDIETGLEVLRDEQAVVKVSDEPIKRGDLITVNIQELDRSGVPLLTHNWKDIPIEVGKSQFGDEADERLLGKQTGDTINAKISSNEESAGDEEDISYSFEILEVKSKELPEIDDHFARSIDEKFESIDDLCKGIKNHMRARASQRARARMLGRIVEHMIEQNRIEVPPSMIEKYLERMLEGARKNGEKLEEENFKEKYRNSAIRNLKWHLLRKKLIAQFELAASLEDIEAELERISNAGGFSLETVKNIYAPEKQQNRLKDDIEERKVLDFLEQRAKISSREINYRKFMGAPES